MRAGRTLSSALKKDSFGDDKYLEPVLKDDALLYNLDEVGDGPEPLHRDDEDKASKDDPKILHAKIAELEEQLERLNSQFASFRETVKVVMDERLEAQTATLSSSLDAEGGAEKTKEAEQSYFKSYSYNG